MRASASTESADLGAMVRMTSEGPIHYKKEREGKNFGKNQFCSCKGETGTRNSTGTKNSLKEIPSQHKTMFLEIRASC